MHLKEWPKRVKTYSISKDAKSFSDRFIGWLKVVWIGCKVFYNNGLFAKDIPALAFATFTSLVPLLAIVFAIARGFGFDQYVTDWLMNSFRSQAVITERLVIYVGNYLENTSSTPIFVAGILFMLYALYSLINKIETSFNGIWETRERPVKKMLYDYTMITAAMGIMIAISSCVYVFPAFAENYLMSFIVNVLTTMAFLILVYKYIPNTFVSLKSVVFPSFLASILVTALQYGYTYLQVYLTSYNVIYGSLAVLPLFLLWLQFMWTIVIAGVVICYAYQNLHHHDGGVEFSSVGHDEMLMSSALILGTICKRFQQPQGMKENGEYTPVELQEITGLPQQVVNGIIRNLTDAKLIQELKGENKGLQEEMSRYVPICDTKSITFGYMVSMLEQTGCRCCLANIGKGSHSSAWNQIKELRKKYIEEGNEILLSEI